MAYVRSPPLATHINTAALATSGEMLSGIDADGGAVARSLRDHLDTLLMWGGLLTGLLGMLGEALGWWGELGLVLTIGGFAAGLYGMLDRKGTALLALARPMAAGIEETRAATRLLVVGQEQVLATQERMLETQDRVLTTQEQVLGTQERVVEGLGATLAELQYVSALLNDRLPQA